MAGSRDARNLSGSPPRARRRGRLKTLKTGTWEDDADLEKGHGHGVRNERRRSIEDVSSVGGTGPSRDLVKKQCSFPSNEVLARLGLYSC
jgi:hypothetical protein